MRQGTGFSGVILRDGEESAAEVESLRKAMAEKGIKAGSAAAGDGFFLSHSDLMEQDDTVVAVSGRVLSHADAPVEQQIADAYDRYGLSFPSHINGSFCAAIYDRNTDRLHLLTDKTGTQPLYYTVVDNGIVFSTHLTALLASPRIDATLDRERILDYLSSVFVPPPGTLLQGVTKLQPSEIMVWKENQMQRTTYWRLPEKKQRLSDASVVQRTRDLLKEASNHLIADDRSAPPILFSGGLDSTFLVQWFTKVMDAPVRTFTWGVTDDIIAAGQERAEQINVPHQQIRFPTELVTPEELWIAEEPRPNLFYRRYTLLPQYGITTCLSGAGSEAVFPYNSRTVTITDKLYPARRLVQALNRMGLTKLIHRLPQSDSTTHRVDSVYDKINFEVTRIKTMTEILSSPTHSKIMSNTETLPDHTLQSMLPADTDYSLETLPQSIDQRWGLADRSFDNLQEMKTYLLFREALLPGEIGQKFRNVHHYSPFIYPPLAAYQFSLPMQQRRNRRILRMVGKDLIPDSCISTADNLLYRGEFLEYFAANRGVYEDAMNQFLERGFLDSERAATVLMPDALHKVSTERLTFMAAVYLLERWIQTMIERKDAWKRP